MLFLTDLTRKLSAALSSVWMLMLTLLPTLTAVADDAAFTAGKAAAQAGVTQSMQVFQNSNQLQTMGITGLGTQVAPGNLTALYKGQGKNGADAVGALHQQGLATMQSQQQCTSTDAGCLAMQTLRNNYNNAVSGVDPTSSYKQRAKAIQAAQLNGDPLAILGIGIPAPNGGSVCVNSTATAPAYQTSQSCLQATFQTIKYTPILPVTSTVTNASPYCIDPTMTLTANQSLCTKTTYSCPSGGSLNGQLCTDVTSVGYSYTSPYCIDASMTLKGDKSLCEKQTYSCPNGGTLNGVQCVINSSPNVSYSGCATANSGGSWTEYIASGQDYWKVQARCGAGGNSIEILADAQGSQGNGGTAGYWASLPIGSYSNKYTHISTPHWGGSIQAYATAVTGNCSGGNCSYQISFDWANIGVPTNSCLNYGYDNEGNYTCIQYSSALAWVHHSYECTSYDSEGNCSHYQDSNDVRNALANGWVQSGFTARTVLSFPQNASYSCPSGGTVQNGQCVMTYPATATYSSATPGCLGGYAFIGNSCQSVPVCPTGFSKTNTTSSGITCSKTYPATPNTATASPGCYTPTIPSGASSGGTQLVAAMVNGQAGMTCQTIFYSCPAGMNMNGMTCEDPSAVNYANNPNCKRLGVNMAERLQGFLCINNKLDECLELDLTGCMNTSNSCIYMDEVQGSDTYNQCIATERKYSCQKPQQTANINRCGYEPMCYNGNCFTPPGTQCAATATGDECTTDLAQVMVGLETARQAGNYMTQDTLRLFSGESDRCDRRSVSVLGAGLGSKSCCNVSAPDAKPNSQLFGSPIAQGVSLLGSGVSAGSSYVYDYMMSSQKFVTAAQEMWAAGALTDNMAQQGLNVAQSSAESLANFQFSPSVSLVPGLSIGYGALPQLGSGSAVFGAGTTSTVAAGTGSVATTTTVGGISTTTTTTAIGNSGFNISYNPTMLYITAAMMAWQAYNAALACDEADYKTATKSNAKLCYEYDAWCASQDCGLFGCTCTKFRTGKCCYNSKLARIINQQGRGQLGLALSDCSGLTVENVQQLDWSRIDLSEFMADMLAQAQQSSSVIMNATTQQQLQNKLTNTTTQNVTNRVQPKLPISQ